MSSRKQRWLDHHLNRDVERQLRKKAQRGPAPNRVRRRDWRLSDHPGDDPDDDESVQVERILPRGYRERLRANLTAVLAGREEASVTDGPVPSAGLLTGVVSRIGTNTCEVLVAEQRYVCRIRSCGLDGAVPVVGDRVSLRQVGDGEGVVEHILARSTVLMRAGVSAKSQAQVIVANADQLLVVASWRQPPIWFELIDRYLIAAARGGLRAIVCVNKVDLAEDDECYAALTPYRRLGYPVVLTSAVTGAGMDDLRSILQGQTTVLAGLSGVGKSSLPRALLPHTSLRVGEVSRHSGQGRHTTTQAERIPLPCGGAVIDTPGIREFGLAGLTRDALAAYYPEFTALAGGCRFANCTHSGEPDCAVARAAGGDAVLAQRYSNYLKILSSLSL